MSTPLELRGPRPARAPGHGASLGPAVGSPALTVIVPVYNEAATIERLLRRVVAAPYDKQVVVVDDGSTDGTAEFLRRWDGHTDIELLKHITNCGKGAAIRTVQAGKKIRFSDGLEALRTLWRWRKWRATLPGDWRRDVTPKRRPADPDVGGAE